MTQKSQRVDLSVTGNTTIRIVAYPSDSNVGCTATVDFRAGDVDPYVERCMGTQMCLIELGNDQAGYELRNNNQKQYDCLKGNYADASCTAFDTCLVKGGYKDDLMKILQGVYGAGSQSYALADIGSTTGTKDTMGGSLAAKTGSAAKVRQYSQKLNVSMDSGCFNPYAGDPEAYDCECLDQDRAVCEANGVELSECIRLALCNRCEVCADWKHDRCTTLEQQSAEAACAQAFLQKHSTPDSPVGIKSKSLFERAGAADEMESLVELDSSVRGKCTR
jgi:hypothetical protein